MTDFFTEVSDVTDSTGAPLVGGQTVTARIRKLPHQSKPEFNTFLQAVSDFLSEPAAGVSPDFNLGLEMIEDRIHVECVKRAVQQGLKVPDIEDVAKLIGRRYDDNIWTEELRKNIKPLIRHLVSHVLTEIEHEVGLSMSRSRAVTLSGLVGNDDFRKKLIKAGLTWKDPGVNGTHGEYTHRIQWCAVALAMPRPVAKLRLSYKFIGLYEDNDQYDGMTFGLWDALVDRNPFPMDLSAPPTPYSTASANDFRSAENLQKHLRTQQQNPKIRLLASFVEARAVKKRTAAAGKVYPRNLWVNDTLPWPPTQAEWNSWARTLFDNRIVDDLSGEEKATLVRAWYRLTKLERDGVTPTNPIMILDVAGDVQLPPAVARDLLEAYKALGIPEVFRWLTPALRP